MSKAAGRFSSAFFSSSGSVVSGVLVGVGGCGNMRYHTSALLSTPLFSSCLLFLWFSDAANVLDVVIVELARQYQSRTRFLRVAKKSA